MSLPVENSVYVTFDLLPVFLAQQQVSPQIQPESGVNAHDRGHPNSRQ